MKTKKRVLSTILSLSSLLLVGCNKTSPSSSSCSVKTSTPTSVNPTPTKTVEELNNELFENYAIIEENVSNETGIYLTGFESDIPEEYLNLETIIIPETIRGISLEHISSGTGDSNNMFTSFVNVKTIKIPATLKSIFNSNDGYYSTAFVNLPNLENIEVDKNNPWYYSEGNCLIQRDWVSTNDRTPNGIYTIKCGWKDVVIPKDVKTIREYAFSFNSSITSIKLHNEINSIGQTSFRYIDNLTNIDFNNNPDYTIEPNSNILNKGGTVYGAWGDVTIPDSIVSPNLGGFTSITSIKIHSNVNLNGALKRLPKLVSVELINNPNYTIEGNLLFNNNGIIYGAWGDVRMPNRVVQASFDGFESVTSVQLNNNVTALNGFAFRNTNIKTLHIPASVEKIDTSVFNGLTDIENITIEENENFEVVSGCLITKPTDNTTAPTIVYAWGNVTIPDSITSPILDGFASVKTVTLHNKVSELPKNAFRDTQIKTLSIPDSVTTIHPGAFNELTSIKKIEIDENNSSYEIIDNCILRKNNLFSLTYAYGDAIIPDKKDQVSNSALQYAYSLKSLTLHNKFEKLASSCFNNIPKTNKFTTIKFKGTIEEFKTVKDVTSLYDTLKDRTMMNIEFLELDSQNNWVVKEKYLMRDLANKN